MNEHYESLMKLKGAEELHSLIKKWDALSSNISVMPENAPILLPDLLLYTKPGYGNTALLQLVSDYLESKQNLMTFCGDVKFFEFLLNYTPPGEDFRELRRLMEEVRLAAGFRNEYRGIVRIKMDEWLGHHEEKHFFEFLEYLSVNSDNWLIILTLSKPCGEKSKEMEAVLSMYLRIETVQLRLPNSAEIMEFIEGQLAVYGLTLEEDAKALLRESVKRLRKNKYFDGMHTIRLFCGDIAYYCFSGPLGGRKMLRAEDLKCFAADSEYISRKITKTEHTRIGFDVYGG